MSEKDEIVGLGGDKKPAVERRQTKVLFNMGIQVCPSCGYLQPIDFKHCKNCKEFILYERDSKNAED